MRESVTPSLPPPGRERLASATILGAAATSLALYAWNALRLVRYPWDWTPDEGLDLDWARRLLEAPSTLYDAGSVVPFPCAYGPALPLLLAPVVALAGSPLLAARLLALAWTACGAAVVYRLVRREGPAPLAAAAAALSLAALDVTYWSMHVRVDGLLIALWLLSALALMPRRLERGADRLGTGRLVSGTALLLAATLAKPTAALHGLPLVLAWLLVDLRSAVVLALALGASGLAALGALQWATSGGFLAVARLWTHHPSFPGQTAPIVKFYLSRTAPLFLPLAAALVVSRARGRLLRDGSLVLLAGALASLPLMDKSGATWNYLVLLPPALAVVAGRWWAGPEGSARRPLLGAALTASVALGLALTRVFPLPTPEDERTARAFYDYITSEVARSGGPILASRPAYAYWLVGQPVEIEGSGFPYLVEAGAPGSERVLERLRRREYTLLAMSWELPQSAEYWAAIEAAYEHVGGCDMRHSLGMQHAHIFVRRDLRRIQRPPPGARCGTSIRIPKAAPAAPPEGLD